MTDRAAIAARHRAWSPVSGPRCIKDHQAWPCDTRQALEAQPVGLDVERLWRVLDGFGVIDNGTWVSFRRADAEQIAAEYARLAEPRP